MNESKSSSQMKPSQMRVHPSTSFFAVSEAIVYNSAFSAPQAGISKYRFKIRQKPLKILLHGKTFNVFARPATQLERGQKSLYAQ